MKKLFLRDSKLWVGEFPDKAYPTNSLIYAGTADFLDAQEDYKAAVESAKAGAVEVVNLESFSITNSSLLDDIKANEGLLHDIPSGWKVEYEDVPLKLYKQKVVEKIARLIPTSENAQGEKAATKAYNSAVDLVDAIHKVSAGIVATGGIPEAEQPEALTFLNEDDWTVPESGAPTYAARLACTRWLSQCLEFGWRKDQLDGLEKIWWQHHDRNGVLVKPDKAVSPPSQAEECDRLSNAWQRCANKLTAAQDENKRLRDALKTCIDDLMYESTTGHLWMWARSNCPVPEKLLEARKLLNL